MMIEEFAERTGFRPSYDYYADVIEPEYMNGTDDKDKFCKKWVKAGGIQKAYDALRKGMEKEKEQFESMIAEKDRMMKINAQIIAMADEKMNALKDELQATQKELAELKAALKTINQIVAA